MQMRFYVKVSETCICVRSFLIFLSLFLPHPQLVTFRALRKGVGKEHVKKEKVKLAEVQDEGCQGYSTVEFDRKPLLVPSCPGSELTGCSIINIEYYVEVSDLLCIQGGLGVKFCHI